jgi:FERM C-terminal PH-like domain
MLRIVRNCFSSMHTRVCTQGCEQVHTFIFRLASERSCKQLWSSAVEHHIFFRLTGPSLQNQTGRPSASNRSSFRSTSSLFRSSSSKFSLFERRMQREMSSQRARGGVRRSVNVVRRPSQRHPRRPSSSNGTGLQRSRTIATTHGRDNRYTSSSVSR